MATLFFNRVMFRAASGGLGDFVVSAAITGYRTPLDASIPDNTIVSYTAESDDKTQWETGLGTYATGTVTLDRTTVYESTNANALVNFTAAPKVWVDWFAQNVAGDSLVTQVLFNAGGTPATVSGDTGFVFNGTTNVLVNSGNLGLVGIGETPDFAGWGVFYRVLSIKGPGVDRGGILELVTSQVDASGNEPGYIDWVAPSNTSGKEVAQIWALTVGATALNRGGAIHFGTKPDGGAGPVDRLQITSAGRLEFANTSNTDGRDENVVTLADGPTVALNSALGRTFKLVSTQNPTILTPTNAPTSGFGQKMVIIFEASGANRTLTLTTGAAAFRYGTDITGLTVTLSGTADYVGAIWNQLDGFWDVVSYVKGF